MTKKSFGLPAILLCLTLLRAIAPASGKGLQPELFVRESSTLLAAPGSVRICGLAKKGQPVLLLQPDIIFSLESSGKTYLKVRTADGSVGYIKSSCLTPDREKIEKSDIIAREKPCFADNPMPEVCYGLYITASRPSLEKIDEYIELAKTTRINTFVIDIKEDGIPGFKAEAMKHYCPSAYKAAGNNEEVYRKAVSKIQEAGYWAVGRIVTFKDRHFTEDHPECAIIDKETGELLYHNKSHWPSAYSRLVWEYNAALACEAVEKIGFNEINFDYVRFPDRITSIENSIDMRNKYAETKVQAVQRFVEYAAGVLHDRHVYISIDVFGEVANSGYITQYGQYWPAISNAADVICGMPYPDHFSNGYYGIEKPWNHPYEILHAWGTRAMAMQAETPSPAKVRTWVQCYHVMRFVDRNGIDYNAENIEKEIRALFDSGLTGGYTTWLSSGNLDRYREKADAFRIDYYNDWISRSNNTGNEEKLDPGPGADY